MLRVRFYDQVEDSRITFAVVIAEHQKQWLLCKHKARETWECPGGHREAGESVTATARRELWEETGATAYALTPVCVYSVQDAQGLVHRERESFGMLFYAQIEALGELPDYEIERVALFGDLPERLTYPDVHPRLVQRAVEALRGSDAQGVHRL